jgi:integrase
MIEPAPFKIHYIPPEQWPVACQDQWHKAFQDDDLFGTRKPASEWRKSSIQKARCGLGSLISWLLYKELFNPHAQIKDIVTQEHIKGFIADMQLSNYAPNTLFCHAQEVYDAARVMDPSQNWKWLLNALKKVRSKAKPIRNKLKRLQPAQKLDRLGRRLMTEAQNNFDLTFYKRALMFRDGLMIATLIHRPLRLSNFASIDLEHRLTLFAESAILSFPADEMKGKRDFEAHFPPQLISELNIYIDLYRPYLLSLKHEDTPDQVMGLWISNEGKQLADLSLRNAIKKRTLREFGQDLTPHLFRDCAVTSLVRDAPESARITRSILTHSTIETTNKYYNQAQMIDTSRRHTDLIERLVAQ